jgi:anti-sigma B factor antagonist
MLPRAAQPLAGNSIVIAGKEFPMGITCNVRHARGVAVVNLGGRIVVGELVTVGSGSGVSLHELVRNLVKQGDKNILLNLRDVTYVDSSGIGELFACSTTVLGQGGVLKLSNPIERVQNVLRLTMLNTVIEVIEDEVTAVQSFSKEGAA